MKIVRMNGGLGNQLFQYIFFRYIEEMTGDICYIDDRELCVDNPIHNGYEIERIFSLKPKRLSEYFDKDVWEDIMKSTMYKRTSDMVSLLTEYGLDILLAEEGDLYERETGYKEKRYSIGVNSFNDEISKVSGNVYYYGYWINANWFAAIKNIILNELAFPPLKNAEDQKCLEIIRSRSTVGVHIRRGDFVDLGWELSHVWYVETLSYFQKNFKNPTYVVFTDDSDWVKNNLGQLGFKNKDKILIPQRDKKEDNYVDMQLMSQCRNMIIANSSFSYLASLLNQSKNKLILNPVEYREII